MESETRELLVTRGLGEFCPALEQMGLRTLEDLGLIHRQDLEAIKMNLVQIRKYEQCVTEASIMVADASESTAPVGRRTSTSPKNGYEGESVLSSTSVGSAANGNEKKGGFRASFAALNIFKKKAPTGGKGEPMQLESGSTAGAQSSQGGSDFDDAASRRSSTEPATLSRKEGGGYNAGGWREGGIDETLTLDIRIVRLPKWDESQTVQGASSWTATLAYYRGHAKWEEIKPDDGRPGCTPVNVNRGSKYYCAETVQEVRSGSVISEVKVPAVKAVATIHASARRVLALLIQNDTAAMRERGVDLDGTFVNGQVLRLCSPRTPDGKYEAYTFPQVPICTIKRSCHRLPDSKSRRDFIFRDFTGLFPVDGMEWGFRTLLSSPDITECENRGDASMVRGVIFEGSGFVVEPLSEDSCRLAFILIASTEAAGKFSFNRMGRAVKHLEAMVSYVDSIRVFVESRLQNYGSCGAEAGFPEEAYHADETNRSRSPSPASASGKAARFLGETTRSRSPSPASASGQAARLLGESEGVATSSRRTTMSSIGKSELGDGAPERESGAPLPLTIRTSSMLTADMRVLQAAMDDEYGEGTSGSEAVSVASGNTTPPSSKAEADARFKQELEDMRRSYEFKLQQEKAAREKEMEEKLEEMRRQFEKAAASNAVQAAPVVGRGAAAEAGGVAASAAVLAGASSAFKAAPRHEEASGADTPLEDGASPTMEQEIERLRRLLSKYREFLPKDVDEADLEVSLDEAEKRMKDAVRILMSSEDEKEQLKAQADFDKWDSIVQNHPEFKEREKQKWIDWEEGNRPKNKACLEEMKSVIKESYFSMTPQDLEAQGVPALLIKRLAQKKVLQLLHKDEEEIGKIHHVALLGQFSSQGLDIVELRALYSVVPEQFGNDPEGKKAQWRMTIRTKLDELIKKEVAGSLRGEEKRSKAYGVDSAGSPSPSVGVPASGARSARPPSALQAGLAAALAGRGPPGATPRGPPAGLADALAARGPPRGPPAGLADALAARGPPRGPPAGLADALAARGPPRGPPAGLAAALAARADSDAATATSSSSQGLLDAIKKRQQPAHHEVPQKTTVTDSDIMKNLERTFSSAKASVEPSTRQATQESGSANPPVLLPKPAEASVEPGTRQATQESGSANPPPLLPKPRSLTKSDEEFDGELQKALASSFGSTTSSASKLPSPPPAPAVLEAKAGGEQRKATADDWEASLINSLADKFKR